LERLHKIDVAATALDQLAQDYDSKSRALKGEMSTRRATWDVEIKARERAEKEYGRQSHRRRIRRAGTVAREPDRHGAGENALRTGVASSP
jgi:hypothetical protein